MDEDGNIFNSEGVFIGTANTNDVENEEVESPIWTTH